MAKLDYKPAERVAFAGLWVQLIAGLIALVFYYILGAACVRIFMWQSLLGVPLWLMAMAHLRQRRLAEEEAIEWERIEAERRAGGARGALFEADEIRGFAERNRLRFMERVLSQIVCAVLILGIAGLAAYMIAYGVVGDRTLRADRALLGLFSFVGVTFVLFLIANYASGMARQATWRSLRAPASLMMFSALFSFASVIVLGFAVFNVFRPDMYVSYAMIAALALVGLEFLINFILEFYRPVMEGVEFRAGYDSRLMGLLLEPGGILKTVAETLDYQFGFRISETWFYQMIEQMVAPVILFLVLVLYALTSVVIVGADERGVLERFGRFERVVEPGFHLKRPWPIDRIYRFRANDTKLLMLGHAGESTVKDKITWDSRHYKTEYETLVAAETVSESGAIPVNLLVAAISVRYRIKDSKDALESWFYKFANPEMLLEALCSREQQRYLAGADFIKVLGVDRAKTSRELRAQMQAAADAAGMGVEILNVGLEEIHPPIEDMAGAGGMTLAEAFQKQVQALEQEQVDKLKAEQEEIATRVTVEIEKNKTLYDAHADYGERVYREAGLAQLFKTQSDVYQSGAREVFKVQRRMDVLERKYGDVRKIVVGAPSNRQHLRLNLEDPKLSLEDIPQFERASSGPEAEDRNRLLRQSGTR